MSSRSGWLIAGSCFLLAGPARGEMGTTTIPLRWTAPGDNGADGGAAAYELRYGTLPIPPDTLSWWEHATPLPAPAPGVAGSVESWDVRLPHARGSYAIVLRAVYERGNRSDFSNALLVDPSAPVARFELDGPRPNPTGAPVRIGYRAPTRAASEESLRIFDLSGALVRTVGPLDSMPGPHTASWDGRDHRGRPVAAGVYIVTFSGRNGSGFSRKIHLVR